MKTSDVRLLGEAELQSELDKARQAVLNLRCRIALGEEVKPGEVKAARRDIARMLTVQNERRRQAPQPAESEIQA